MKVTLNMETIAKDLTTSEVKENVGYQIVVPDLPSYREDNADCDSICRCLSYLIKKIDIPRRLSSELEFLVIPVQYLGPPYPAIGIKSDKTIDGIDLTLLSFQIEDQLTSVIEQMGMDELIIESRNEDITWDQVLHL